MENLRIGLIGATGAGRSSLIRSLGGQAGRAEIVPSTTRVGARVRLRVEAFGSEGEAASGILVLINHHGPASGHQLEEGLKQARQTRTGVPVVVAVTHLDGAGLAGLNEYFRYLGERQLEYRLFPLDPRNALQARILMEEMAVTLTRTGCLPA